MGAAVILVQEEADVGEDSGYAFTTVIKNKHTGEVVKEIRYKQVLLTFEEFAEMEDNLGNEKDHLSH